MYRFCSKRRTILPIVTVMIASIVHTPLLASENSFSKSSNLKQASAFKQAKVLSRGGQTQLLIKPKAGVDKNRIEALNDEVDAVKRSTINRLGVISVDIRGSVQGALDKYKSSGLVEYAEPNYLRKAAGFTPNDSYFSEQWGLKKIGMEEAWTDLGLNPQEVRVAILDTGVDYNHEDLQGIFATDPTRSNAILGKHFYTDTSGKQTSDFNIEDKAGHGTHIAGIIGATANNGTGVAGICARARVMPIKVLDDVGYGDDANIAQGLIWATDNGARVVNMSLAGPSKSKTLADAIKYATGRGVVVVAATGNEGSMAPNYPASYDGVIGVGATDVNDLWMEESNYGPYVDVVAPGVSIKSSFPALKSYDGTQYEVSTGTSMAAGFVSGLAALILSKNGAMSDEQVKGIMLVSADDLGQTGWDRYFGYGRINAAKALRFTSDIIKPAVSIVSPFNMTKIEASTFEVTATASDAESGISFVDFLVNGERFGSAANPPYKASLQTKGLNGLNKIQAIAYDKNGNSTTSEISCFKQSFFDVPSDYWAFQDIESLQKSKVLSGYPDKSFKPGNFVGRAEFVKMLIEGLGLSKKHYYSGYFKDVPKTYWAWPYIEAAYDLSLIHI
jgi:subtilisin family serine protease